MKLEILEKNEIQRALYGDYKHRIKTFAIFTAENPIGKHLEPSENNKRTNELKKIFKQMNLQYISISGRFDVEDSKIKRNYGDSKYEKSLSRDEHSFVVINISLSEAKGICEKFDQLSFFFGEQTWTNDGSSDDLNTSSTLYYYEKKDKNSDYVMVDSSRKVKDASTFDNFFSRHKNFKYSICMKIFGNYESLNDVLDVDCLLESLKDDRTSFFRSTRRYHAYNGTFLK